MRKLLFVLGIVFIGSLFSGLKAQQLPISNQYVYVPAMWNPAAMGTHEFNRLWISHQQRKVAFKGLANSQIMTYNSMAQGSREKMGWGLLMTNDFEFTENRLNLSLALSFHLINKTRYWEDDEGNEYLDFHQRLSLGAMAGIVNWSQNYDDFPLFNRGDALLAQTSITKPDLGFGIDYIYENPIMRITVGAGAFQLPEWMFQTDAADTLITVPHFKARAGFMLHVTSNFSVGPMVMYKDVYGNKAIFGQNLSIQKGIFDTNLKFEMPQTGVWWGAGYRFNNSAVNAGFGFRMMDKDTTRSGKYFPQRWDMTGIFEYPINTSRTFGPTFELGLNYTFGSLKRIEYDTVEVYRGPFWANTGNLNDFLIKRTNGNPIPDDIFARSDYRKKYVTLTYTFSDNTFQYNPENIVGLMELLSHLERDVLKEAFYSTDERDRDYPDYLYELESVQFNCLLREDNIGALKMADSTLYKGRRREETVLYDEKDSTFVVERGLVNNLELSYLKLANTRDRLMDLLEDRVIMERPLNNVDWMQLKITSNNPRLESFQENKITLIFVKKQRKRKIFQSN